MKIQGPAPQPPKRPTKLDNFWHELTSGELLEASLRMTPEKLHGAVEASRDIGKAVGKAWEGLRDQVREVFNLPVIEEKIDPQTREKLTDILLTTASVVGYSVAGVQGLAGLMKLKKGVEQKSTVKKLEGALDLATAGAIITTIAGAGPAPLVLIPLAAALGVARGVTNSVSGYRHADGRKEVQGTLDAIRSAGTMCALLASKHTAFTVGGAVLGPIAGAVQLARGYVDLERGLETDNKPQMLAGLADVGSAVGLTLALTGLGTIPGVALTVASVGVRLGYQLSDKFEARVDKVLDKVKPSLAKVVATTEKVVDPVLAFVRPLVDKVTGWEHGDQLDEPPPPKA